MSTIERNKGTLIPVTFDDVLMEYPEADINDLPWDTEGNFQHIGDNIYKVLWEVKGEGDCSYFADVKLNPDGSIDFHTLHYNGGGYWTEVIEGELKK